MRCRCSASCYRSYQDPGTFIGLELRVIPVPRGWYGLAAVATGGLLAYWVFRRIQAWRMGRLAAVHTLYMLSHFAIFAVGYLLIDGHHLRLAGRQHLAQRAVHPVRLAVQHAPIQGRHRSGGALPLLYQPAAPAVALSPDLRGDHRRLLWACSAR